MDELRQRHSAKPSLKSSLPRVQSMVKNLDLFPKVHDDYVVRTNEGGISRCEFLDVIRSVYSYNGNYAVSGTNGDLYFHDSSAARCGDSQRII